MQNIILIGMPGAGKSTIGVVLAKSLGLSFVDTDLQIQESTEQLLQDIINTNGIEHFLKIEEKTILAHTYKRSVVATGGSVVYSDKAMAHLKNSGLCIYLSVDYTELVRRLDNIKTRGIAMGKHQSLQELFDERKKLYEKYADMTIDCKNQTIESIVTEIVGKL